MVNIGKLHINLLILPLVLVAAVTHTLQSTAVAYVVVAVHEFAHFYAAKRCGVEVGGLVIMPFGVSLQLKERYIRDTAADMYICAAGPFGNVVMILIGAAARRYYPQYGEMVDFFILSNVSILLINIVPILPLDGGRLLRAYLAGGIGYVRAYRITRVISGVCIVAVAILGVAALWYTRFNVSLVLLSAFLVFNMSAEKQNNEFLVMQQVLHSPQKLKKEGMMPIKALAVMADTPPSQLLKNFSYNHFYIVNVYDENAAVIGTLSETQIIRAMMDGAEKARVGDMLMTAPRHPGLDPGYPAR